VTGRQTVSPGTSRPPMVNDARLSTAGMARVRYLRGASDGESGGSEPETRPDGRGARASRFPGTCPATPGARY
jgi:hypothetical protein